MVLSFIREKRTTHAYITALKQVLTAANLFSKIYDSSM